MENLKNQTTRYNQLGALQMGLFRSSFVVFLLVSIFIVSAISSVQATYTDTTSITINSDGSVTPMSAPVEKNGNNYKFTDNVDKASSTNECLIIKKSNIVVDGAGFTLKGHGQSSAIIMKDLLGVTVKGFVLDNFYWGLEIWNCSQCTFYNNDLSSVMYNIYIRDSSNNKFCHNNIYDSPYCMNSNNIWDDGYPSGGNYWEGYPYIDVKNGPNQDISGSDGIGDVAIGEEIFGQGGTNIDRYPIMTKVVIGVDNPSASPSVLPSAMPSQNPAYTPSPSSTVPEITPVVMVVGLVAFAMLVLIAKKKLL